MPSLNEPFIWPTRPIVSPVFCESSAWLLGPKATELVGSVWFAVSCPNLRLLSISRSFWGRCGGWMWQDARFVASGQPTGGGNMLRCFHYLRLCLRENLLLVHPELFVRAIA